MLILTMSVFTDRAGVSFGQDVPVEPDDIIAGDPSVAATDWLLTQPPCKG
jgi:hypothetical protein